MDIRYTYACRSGVNPRASSWESKHKSPLLTFHILDACLQIGMIQAAAGFCTYYTMYVEPLTLIDAATLFIDPCFSFDTTIVCTCVTLKVLHSRSLSIANHVVVLQRRVRHACGFSLTSCSSSKFISCHYVGTLGMLNTGGCRPGYLVCVVSGTIKTSKPWKTATGRCVTASLSVCLFHKMLLLSEVTCVCISHKLRY